MFYLSLFCSRMWQKSSAAARMCKNIGSFMACANSNCFSKYLFFTRWKRKDVQSLSRLTRMGRRKFHQKVFPHWLSPLHLPQIPHNKPKKIREKNISSKHILFLNLTRAKVNPVIVQSTFTNCYHLV